jgi:hypothetical protein
MQNSYQDPWQPAADATVRAPYGVGSTNDPWSPENFSRSLSQTGPDYGGGRDSSMNWGEALGPFASGLAGLFEDQGGGGDYGQIGDLIKKYFSPYQQMMDDPGALLSRFGSQYTKSPGYDFELGQAEGAGSRAAAEGGMAGSPMEQQQAQQTAQGYASRDYGNFMNRILGLYGTGAQGYSQEGEELIRNLMNEMRSNQYQSGRQGADIGSMISGLATLFI